MRRSRARGVIYLAALATYLVTIFCVHEPGWVFPYDFVDALHEFAYVFLPLSCFLLPFEVSFFPARPLSFPALAV